MLGECFLNLSEQGLRAVCEVVLEVVLLVSLSNKDGDGNENGSNRFRLAKQQLQLKTARANQTTGLTKLDQWFSGKLGTRSRV